MIRRLLGILIAFVLVGLGVNRCTLVRGLWHSANSHSSPACRIKGNISVMGERIYHVPGQAYYDSTRIDTLKGERWFCTEAEARAAGWRKAHDY